MLCEIARLLNEAQPTSSERRDKAFFDMLAAADGNKFAKYLASSRSTEPYILWMQCKHIANHFAIKNRAYLTWHHASRQFRVEAQKRKQRRRRTNRTPQLMPFKARRRRLKSAPIARVCPVHAAPAVKRVERIEHAEQKTERITGRAALRAFASAITPVDRAALRTLPVDRAALTAFATRTEPVAERTERPHGVAAIKKWCDMSSAWAD